MSKEEAGRQKAKQVHGTKDATKKILFAQNDVFADILNTLFFHTEDGKISPEDLSDTQEFSSYMANAEYHSQARDVAKYIKKQGVTVSMIGYEFQSKSETNMPIRVMSYDAANYRLQLNNQSGRVYPVITVVLYFGQGNWTGERNLLGCLDLSQISPEMREMVSDYKMKNIIDLSRLTEQQVKDFTSSFQIVAYRLYQDRQSTAKKLDDIYCKAWDRDQMEKAIDAVNALEGRPAMDKSWLERKEIMNKSKVSLQEVESPFIDRQVAKGKAEGVIKGKAETIVNMMNAFHVSLEEAMQVAKVTEEEKAACLAEIARLQKEQ